MAPFLTVGGWTLRTVIVQFFAMERELDLTGTEHEVSDRIVSQRVDWANGLLIGARHGRRGAGRCRLGGRPRVFWWHWRSTAGARVGDDAMIAHGAMADRKLQPR